ncbi:MAG TPA: hypothetical protein ENH11_06985 [Candidatus Acetothermia bacterium]|nr:hypothetical protein [Candidatus Acetothermia bacterium]
MQLTAPLALYRTGFGINVFVGGDSDYEVSEKALREFGFSASFCRLVARARTDGCRYLALDCDGPVYEGILKFEW